MKDLLGFADVSPEEFREILRRTAELKRRQKQGIPHPSLQGKVIGMLFEKPSLRTRVTFEVGMTQLGGSAIFLAPQEVSMGRRESVPDIARNLERWVDGIVVRTFAHATAAELARSSRVPVINALTDLFHPCQILADLVTLEEHRGTLEGLRLAYVGDGNNIVHSWIEAAGMLGFELRIGCPEGYEPNKRILAAGRARGGRIEVVEDPFEAVRGAEAVYTDVWASMGQEDEAEERRKVFAPYQLNKRLLKAAARGAYVMHCLPAHRGEEITADVIEGPRSIIFDQAENRLHVQKAILEILVTGSAARLRGAGGCGKGRKA